MLDVPGDRFTEADHGGVGRGPDPNRARATHGSHDGAKTSTIGLNRAHASASFSQDSAQQQLPDAGEERN